MIKRTLRLFSPVMLAVVGFVAMLPQLAIAADDWVDLVGISPTTTLTKDHICFTDGKDLACDDRGFYVDSDGNVGIGTTDPSVTLHVVNGIARFYNIGSGREISVEAANGTIDMNSTLELQRFSTKDLSLVRGGGDVGIGIFSPSTKLDVMGTISATGGYIDGDLTVTGNILAEGNTTIEGVTFSQGGISATGSVSATEFYGDGSNITGVVASSADRLVSGTTSVVASEDASITFSTAGAERMIVDENGKVGIGTTIPAYALDVVGHINTSQDLFFAGAGDHYIRGASTNSNLIFTYWDGAENHNWLTMQDGGKIGIGTTDPSSTLHVMGGVSVTGGNLSLDAGQALVLDNDEGGTSYIADTGNYLRYYHNGSAIYQAGGNLRVDALYATSYFTGYTGVDTVIRQSEADKNTVFQNNTGDAQVIIDSDGKVGIGTTEPSEKLEVAGTVSATGGYIDGDLTVTGNILAEGNTTIEGITFSQGGISATGDVSATEFYGDGSNITGVVASSADRLVSGTTSVVASEDASLTFSTAGSQRMIVDERGFVGIGTDTPMGPLTIKNNTTATDAPIAIFNSNTDRTLKILQPLQTNDETPFTLQTENSIAFEVDNIYAHLYKAAGVYDAHLKVASDRGGANIDLVAEDGSDDIFTNYIRGTTTLWSMGARESTSDFRISNGAYNVASPAFLIQNSTGNVGIGTTDPSVTLHVSGTAQIAMDTGDVCNSAEHLGKMVYNKARGKFQICKE